MRKTNTDPPRYSTTTMTVVAAAAKQRKKLVFSVNYFHARNNRALHSAYKIAEK